MNHSSTNCDNASYPHKDEPNCENEPPSNMPWRMSAIGKAIRLVTLGFGKISLIYVVWRSFIISMSLPDSLVLLKTKLADLVTGALGCFTAARCLWLLLGTLTRPPFVLDMTTQTVLIAAKQGNPQAIAALLNHSLSAKGMTTKVQLTDGCLHIILEAAFVPNQPGAVAYVTKGMRGLSAHGVTSLVLHGRVQGNEFPAWTERVELVGSPTVLVVPAAPLVKPPEPAMPTPRTVFPAVPAVVPPSSVSGNPSQPKATLPWYETRNEMMIIALLVLFFPLGLWSMWKHSTWSLQKKGLI